MAAKSLPNKFFFSIVKPFACRCPTHAEQQLQPGAWYTTMAGTVGLAWPWRNPEKVKTMALKTAAKHAARVNFIIAILPILASVTLTNQRNTSKIARRPVWLRMKHSLRALRSVDFAKESSLRLSCLNGRRVELEQIAFRVEEIKAAAAWPINARHRVDLDA